MAKKKQIYKEGYLKGTRIHMEDVKANVEKAEYAELIDIAKYDDNSESITIRLHLKGDAERESYNNYAS